MHGYARSNDTGKLKIHSMKTRIIVGFGTREKKKMELGNVPFSESVIQNPKEPGKNKTPNETNVDRRKRRKPIRVGYHRSIGGRGRLFPACGEKNRVKPTGHLKT